MTTNNTEITYNTRSPKVDVRLRDGIAATMWPLLDWSPAQGWLVWERMNITLPMFCELFDNRFLLIEKLFLLSFGSIYVTTGSRFHGLLCQ
jgi:hypothetical protein